MSSSQNAVKSPSISPEQTIPVSNATILYTATDFRTTGKKLMGRHAASESFLRAYAKYSGVGDFYCFTPNKSAFQDFAERIQSFIPQQQKAVCRWISPKNFTANSESGCFYTPDPNISHYAWLRRRQDQRAYRDNSYDFLRREHRYSLYAAYRAATALGCAYLHLFCGEVILGAFARAMG